MCIRNGKNSFRLMPRNGRKSCRWLHQEVLFWGGLSWQTWDLCRDAADQCPSVKPWVEPVHSVEAIAHLEPQILKDYRERTENSEETSNSMRPFQNDKGLLVPPGLQV